MSLDPTIESVHHPSIDRPTDRPNPNHPPHTQSLRVYLSAHEDFDYGRDHPLALVWEEEGLSGAPRR